MAQTVEATLGQLVLTEGEILPVVVAQLWLGGAIGTVMGSAREASHALNILSTFSSAAVK